MMKHVVDEGTGHGRADPRSADRRQDRNGADGRERRPRRVVHRVRPRRGPQVAVAVVVERTKQYGGQAAAPIARDVMQAVLDAAS